MKRVIRSIIVISAMVGCFLPARLTVNAGSVSGPSGVNKDPRTTELSAGTAPQVTKVALSVTQAKAGDSVRAMIDVSKSDSTEISFITVDFYTSDHVSGDTTTNLHFGKDYSGAKNGYDVIYLDTAIQPTLKSGTYSVGECTITDTQSRTRTYSISNGALSDVNDPTVKTTDLAAIQITSDPNAPTVEKPVLNSIKMLQTTTAQNSTVQMQYSFTQSNPGISRISIFFLNTETNSESSAVYATKIYSAAFTTGTDTIDVNIGSAKVGKNVINRVIFRDANNESTTIEGADLAKVLNSTNDYVNVTSDGDTSSPVVTNVEVLADTLQETSIASVKIDYTEHGYGISNASATFKYGNTSITLAVPTTATLTKNSTISDITSSITVSMRIPATSVSGTYTLYSVDIADFSGNQTTYSVDKNNLSSIAADINTRKFDIVIDSTVKTNYLSVDTIVDYVKEQDDAAIIRIIPDISTAPAELFQALIGTNKTIIFDDDKGIKWIFKASDIDSTKIKPINVSYQLNIVPDTLNQGKNDVVQIIFPSNGELPGKATLRIKPDYLTAAYKLRTDLILYYANGNSLEKVAANMRWVDGYLEFDVTHNSTYYLSDHEMTKAPAASQETNTTGNTATASESPDTGDNTAAAGYLMIMISAIFSAAVCCSIRKKYSRS